MFDATSVPGALDPRAILARTAATLAWTNPPHRPGIWGGDIDTAERLLRALIATQDALWAALEHCGRVDLDELRLRLVGAR